jgi:hypothetical protein
VESPQLQRLFLLLRKELLASDIPGRTAMCQHILKIFSEYLEKLEEDMKVN